MTLHRNHRLEEARAKDLLERSAELSPGGRYRYLLRRKWGDHRQVTFVMLNPSLADAEVDDPTVRRCMGFAAREGFGCLDVVNLFPYRSTDPEVLRMLDFMTATGGHVNVKWCEFSFRRAELIVLAWGAHPQADRGTHRMLETIERINDERDAIFSDRIPVMCLGKTANGSPKHPLYLPLGTKLEEFYHG